MINFLFVNSHILLTILAVGVFLYVLMKWSSLPVLKRMVGLQFFFVTLHTWEELRFPGGMVEMIEAKMNFTLTNPHFGELVLVAIILIVFIPPLLFPRKMFLVMVPMLLGVLEIIAHTLAIRMFDMPIPYSPGLVTAVFLLFPVSLYSINYAIRNKLVRPRDFVFAFFIMLFGLLVAQQIVIRSSGMEYMEFLNNVRKTM